GAFLAFLAGGAGCTGSALRPGFTSGACFTAGSSCTDEPLQSLRALRTYGARKSRYARDALETLRTGGSVGTDAVVAGWSLWPRGPGRARFAPQLPEDLRTDLVNAPDGVAVVACRFSGTGDPKDTEGTS